MNYFFIEKVTEEKLEDLLYQIQIILKQAFEYQELNIILDEVENKLQKKIF